MKTAHYLAAAAVMFGGTPAFAAKVSANFQNLGTSTMTVTKVNACGVFSPTPPTLTPGQTSPVSSTSCNSAGAAANITYKMDSKQCIFRISVLYTPGNPSLGTTGYYTPSSTAEASGGATCRAINKDISGLDQGNYKATFTMK